jgi:hypothetical protein
MPILDSFLLVFQKHLELRSDLLLVDSSSGVFTISFSVTGKPEVLMLQAVELRVDRHDGKGRRQGRLRDLGEAVFW